MYSRIWKYSAGSGPFIATAIHDGHEIRNGLKDLMFISEMDRLREEDPFTQEWTKMVTTRVIGIRSRFEVDLNREKEKAVYINPEDAWNLKVWKSKLPHNEINYSLIEYDAFYAEMHKILTEMEAQYGHFVVFDLHTYNHMRKGPDEAPADPELNPEVNIGTGNTDRAYWGPVIDIFIRRLRDFNYFGRNLDVRENIKFKGGYFSKWIHQNFPESGCAIAIEFKKFFMDEWTGKPDYDQIKMIKLALESTIPEIQDELKKY